MYINRRCVSFRKRIGNISISGDESICAGESKTLSATPNPDYNYEWSTGETTVSINNHFGLLPHSVTATNQSGGCSSEDEIEVGNLPAPRLILPDTVTFCKGKSRTVLASVNSGDSVVWDNGTAGRYLNITEPGIYTASTYSVCGESHKNQSRLYKKIVVLLYIFPLLLPLMAMV